MEKNEILQAVGQGENNNEYEKKVFSNAWKFALLATHAVLIVIFAVESLILNSNNLGLWVVVSVPLSVSYLYTGIKLKKKFDIVLGIVELLIGAVSFVLWVMMVWNAL